MTTMTKDQVIKKVREARAAGRRADLTDANLRGADLTRADLTNANLRGADLTFADLADANLPCVDLTNADLRDSDLTNADLTAANLTYADLTGADLTGAILTDVWLHGAHLTAKQLLDTRGLRPGGHGLTQDTWAQLLPTNTEQRQLVEHLLRDGWKGSLREAIATAEGLSGR